MQKLEIQGDVALRPATLPGGAKKIKNRPLALGEVSGHAHVVEPNIETDTVDMFEFEGKTFVVTNHDGGQLRHVRLKTGKQADHAPIVLAPNTCYEVLLQNEYNPEEDSFVRVLD